MKLGLSGPVWKIVLPVCLVGAGVAGYAGLTGKTKTDAASTASTMTSVPVTIAGAGGRHVFTVEIARTAAQQEKGLMFRTGIRPDTGMLFWPYPPGGGEPRAASFWMKNTYIPLDIVFIGPDRRILRIANRATPLDTTTIDCPEPVSAVLELNGGIAAREGIKVGDAVDW